MKTLFPLIFILFFSLALRLNAQNPMGVENGWGAWKASTGNYLAGTVNFTATNLSPAAPLFNITNGSGVDFCTPGPALGNPPLPVVAPGFGNHSIQLGQVQISGTSGGCPGGCVERITYSFTPTIFDTNIVVSHAIVMEDGGAGHTGSDQPFVEFMILAPNGDTVPCTYHKFTGGPTAPGFIQSKCGGTYYKPWTTFGTWYLAMYLGQTLTIVITNADCGDGNHFTQSYWDISGNIKPKTCFGQPLTLCAPHDPSTPYSYWWYTKNPYTPISTGQCLTVTPQQNDTFYVGVYTPSGCDFAMEFVPQDTCFVGIQENSDLSSVTVLPNPSSGIFSVAQSESFGEIEIYNLIGERILPLSTVHQSSVMRIDISSQPPGIYFLRINTNQGIVTKKLVLRE